MTKLAPLPPTDLARRVGVNDPEDPLGSFTTIGRASREIVLDLLPDDWSFDGKRVLDFGCGPGKVLLHFLDEANEAEFYGCDIHAPSIEWLQQQLSPPLHVFVNDESPPLPFDDGRLDLIWAFSVFTHIVDHWSAWLVELRRVLAPGGLLIASFLGRASYERITREPWSEDDFGMNVLGYGQPWDDGGPNVFLAPWWIRAHWGRAFEIVQLRHSERGHGFVLLRKPAAGPSPVPEELEWPEPEDPRELRSLQHQVRQLRGEVLDLRSALAAPRVQLPLALQKRRRALRPLAERVKRLAQLRPARSRRSHASDS